MQSSRLPKIAPVEADQLLRAYLIGAEAAAERKPQVDGAAMSAPLRSIGPAQAVDTTETPIDRALVAIGTHFPKDSVLPLITRIAALAKLIRDPEMARYNRPNPDHSDRTEVSQCVFDVAARMPINRDMTFARKQFFEQVAKRFGEHPD